MELVSLSLETPEDVEPPTMIYKSFRRLEGRAYKLLGKLNAMRKQVRAFYFKKLAPLYELMRRTSTPHSSLLTPNFHVVAS